MFCKINRIIWAEPEKKIEARGRPSLMDGGRDRRLSWNGVVTRGVQGLNPYNDYSTKP